MTTPSPYIAQCGDAAAKPYFFDGRITAYKDGSAVWVYATQRAAGEWSTLLMPAPTSPSLKWRKGCPIQPMTQDALQPISVVLDRLVCSISLSHPAMFQDQHRYRCLFLGAVTIPVKMDRRSDLNTCAPPETRFCAGCQ